MHRDTDGRFSRVPRTLTTSRMLTVLAVLVVMMTVGLLALD